MTFDTIRQRLDSVNPIAVEQLRARIYEYIERQQQGITNENGSTYVIDPVDVRNRIEPPKSTTETAVADDDENVLLDLTTNGLMNGNKVNEEVDEKAKDEDETTKTTTNRPIKDFMLKRFLALLARPPGNVDSAFEAFLQTFQFRTQFRLATLTSCMVLPLEFYQLRSFINKGVDREGNRLCVVRARDLRNIPQMDQLIKRGIVYLTEQFDLRVERGEIDGISMVMDPTDMLYRHVTLDMVKFLFHDVLIKYIGSLRHIYVYNIPFMLRPLATLIISWFRTLVNENVEFRTLTDDNIDQYIARNQRPPFLANGTLEYEYSDNGSGGQENGGQDDSTTIPPDTMPFLTLAERLVEQNVLKRENVQRIYQHIQECLDKEMKSREEK